MLHAYHTRPAYKLLLFSQLRQLSLMPASPFPCDFILLGRQNHTSFLPAGFPGHRQGGRGHTGNTYQTHLIPREKGPLPEPTCPTHQSCRAHLLPSSGWGLFISSIPSRGEAKGTQRTGRSI